MINKTTREIAADLLVAVYKDNKKSHLVLKEKLDSLDYLDKRDRSFITRLFKGTVENQIKCDYIISKFSKTKINKIKPLVLAILRMSVYEFLFMKDIPSSAIVNESVKIIKRRGLKGLVPYVNGTLRTISREIDNIAYPDKNDEVLYLSVEYSMPEWIVKLLINEYGFSVAEQVFKYFIKEHEIVLRVNKSKISPVDFEKILKSNDISYKKNKYYSYAFNIYNFEKIEDIPGYNDGLFVVQDPSSMLIGEIASHLKYDNAIDLCSAPGGKAMHLADINNLAEVVSTDVSDSKIEMIENNIARTKLFNIYPEVNDATIIRDDFKARFDIVVMDVPCSGIGVIGTKSDIKYNISKDSIDSLSMIQKQILKNGMLYTKNDKESYIIYSTCTLDKKENIDVVVDNFINSSYEPVDILDYIPVQLKEEWLNIRDEYLLRNNININGNVLNSFVQVVPGINDMNGFFVTVWKKRA